MAFCAMIIITFYFNLEFTRTKKKLYIMVFTTITKKKHIL